ncbi:MAG: DUF2207 domain-containing protein, partial [Clostridia bacterium]|nr:DUF2207 domain-containing protein [Clostridia bacterium]
MKRLLLLLGCLILLTTGVFASESVITDLKTDCLADNRGRCQITQTITVDITGIEQQLLFPLPDGAKKASLAGFDTSRKTVDGYTALALKNSAGFSGSRTFTLIYTVDAEITEKDGVQTLKLPLLCPRWEFPIEHYSFTVMMPDAFDAFPTFVSGYYGDAAEDYMEVQTRDAIVDGFFLAPLKDHESLDMLLEVPSGYFSGTYATWSANWTAVAMVIVLSLAAAGYWFMKLRSPKLRKLSRSLPPDAALPCDLPYLLAQGRPDFNMLICHWGVLGYLSIHVDAKGNVALYKRVEMGNERRRTERKLFDALFARGSICDGASLVYKRTASGAIGAIPKFWNRRLYDKSSGNPLIMKGLSCLVCAIVLLESMGALLPSMKLRWFLIFLSFILGGVLGAVVQDGPAAWFLGKKLRLGCSILAGIVLLIAAKFGSFSMQMLLALALAVWTGFAMLHGGKRTQQGTQIVSQAMGFRRFLLRVSRTHLEMMLRRNGQYFYELLPYAESVGLGGDLLGVGGEAVGNIGAAAGITARPDLRIGDLLAEPLGGTLSSTLGSGT